MQFSAIQYTFMIGTRIIHISNGRMELFTNGVKPKIQ